MKKRKIIKKHAKLKAIHIVKRRGHTEIYDEKKVFGSAYFACRSTHIDELRSEEISGKVCDAVTKQVSKLKTISSHHIFNLIVKELKKYDEDASFMYETHRDIS
jgi:transcriptional regulator NrdR family protein